MNFNIKIIREMCCCLEFDCCVESMFHIRKQTLTLTSYLISIATCWCCFRVIMEQTEYGVDLVEAKSYQCFSPRNILCGCYDYNKIKSIDTKV